MNSLLQRRQLRLEKENLEEDLKEAQTQLQKVSELKKLVEKLQQKLTGKRLDLDQLHVSLPMEESQLHDLERTQEDSSATSIVITSEPEWFQKLKKSKRS